MDEQNYEQAFQLILAAGNAKSAALMAIEAARNGEYARAEEYLQECDSGLEEAHNQQFAMIQKEAQGQTVPMNIILVHANDHLTMALMAKEYAQEMLHLYREIGELRQEIRQAAAR